MLSFRLTRLRQIIRSFAVERKGNVMIIFALALVPLLALMGGLIDYTMAQSAKVRFDAAADAAALAAVSQNAMVKTVAEAQRDAEIFFDENISQSHAHIAERTVTVRNTGLSRSATVTYTAASPASFMGLFGIETVQIGGQARASGVRAPYIDFYLLLDNSPSMGLAATRDEIIRMENATRSIRACAFACHNLSDSNNFYKKAKEIGVQLRIDMVREASQKLMDQASITQTLQNQYRMAAYTFGKSCDGKRLTEIQALTANLSAAKTAAGAIDLMTIPRDQFDNDRCTDFDTTLTSLERLIPTPGDGMSAAAPQKVVFFVSDGVGDFDKSGKCSEPEVPGKQRCQEPIDTKYCNTIKDRGIKIAVLYTTYEPVPSDSWYKDWIRPFASKIPTRMESCASPGLYFEVNPSQGIAEAMLALFQRVVAKSYLSM